jgi:hypothetical protein
MEAEGTSSSLTEEVPAPSAAVMAEKTDQPASGPAPTSGYQPGRGRGDGSNYYGRQVDRSGAHPGGQGAFPRRIRLFPTMYIPLDEVERLCRGDAETRRAFGARRGE